MTNNAPVAPFSIDKISCINARCIVAATALFCALTLPNISKAGPWILLDAKSQEVYSHFEANMPWHPASIVKLMTAYTVFKEIEAGNIDLKSPVKISPQALAIQPTKMGFPVGTIVNVDNALKMLMVKSANDIAIALAQSTKGDLDKFAVAMNSHAVRLGMASSHFTNPHGLHSIDQVTTAKDMALLALAIQNEFPQYAGYFNISAIRFGRRRMKNHNKLIFRFPGSNGMKTGYTCASGLNIVARAKRGDKEFIAVVLGGYSSAERNILAAKLLQGAYDNNFNGEQRPKINSIKPQFQRYAVPHNLRPMVCKRNWSEQQMSRKQRRIVRRKHLANIDLELKKHLDFSPETGPTITVGLGNATGANPFNYKLVNGNVPPISVTPVWRPDKTSAPYE